MKRKKNQGFTLVELLVSIAVLSIVTLGIGGLLRLAAEQYSNSTKETEVQNILQQAVVAVSSSMEDAELGVFFSGNTLTVANREKFIKFEKVGTVLYYDEQEYEDAEDDDEKIDEAKSASVGHAQENVLADHVNTFSVAIPEVLPDGKTGFAVLSLAIQFQERHKDIVQNVFFRNYLSDAFSATSTVASAATPVYTNGSPAANPGNNTNPSNPGNNNNQNPGNNTEPNPGNNTDPNPGNNTDPNPGNNTDPNPGNNTTPSDPGNNGGTKPPALSGTSVRKDGYSENGYRLTLLNQMNKSCTYTLYIGSTPTSVEKWYNAEILGSYDATSKTIQIKVPAYNSDVGIYVKGIDASTEVYVVSVTMNAE